MTVEIAKLRRTKVVILGVLLSAGIILFAGMYLFAEGRIEVFQDDPHASWAGHLVGFCMALAFLSPLQLSLIASRSVDTEHINGGWLLNAMAGVPPGTLIARKLVVSGVLVAVLKIVETAAVLMLPILAGAPAPDAGMLATWVFFGLGAVGTSVALLAVMLWLAAMTEEQAVVLAIGVVGGFLGIAALLSPTWLAAINPFGYYAMLTPFTFEEEGIEALNPHWFLWVIYMLVAAGTFAVVANVLNRKEL